jgi:hypothetical protein
LSSSPSSSYQKIEVPYFLLLKIKGKRIEPARWRTGKEGTLIIRCKTLEESGYLYKAGGKGYCEIACYPYSLMDNAKTLD